MLTGSAVYPFRTEVVLHDAANRSSRAEIDGAGPPPERGPGPASQSLDPKAVDLWRVTLAARGGVAAVVVLGVEILVGSPLATGLLAGLTTVLALATVAILPPLKYRRWRFSLEGQHLRMRHGVLFHTTSIVPYARIQHVDTRHGPVDRWLGLASLVVFTAGTRGAILTIPALAADQAEAIRDRLAALSGVGDAV